MNQDKARECAEEICKGTYGLTQSEVALIIEKHFPPSVPVSKLEECITEYEDGTKCINIDELYALIAEAK